MGEKFSLSGNSILFHKTEKADESTRPSAKIWHLEGDVINDLKSLYTLKIEPESKLESINLSKCKKIKSLDLVEYFLPFLLQDH